VTERMRTISTKHSTELQRGLSTLRREARTRGDDVLIKKKDLERLLCDLPLVVGEAQKENVFCVDEIEALQRAMVERETREGRSQAEFEDWKMKKDEELKRNSLDMVINPWMTRFVWEITTLIFRRRWLRGL
jgi:hypothetical protein